MATGIGVHSRRLTAIRALRTSKGRRDQQRFIFEGSTMLREAAAAGFPLAELYATREAYESSALLRDLESAGTPIYILTPASLAGISAVATPSGIVAVAPNRLAAAGAVLGRHQPALVLADLNDPANAGTLLRSADAFNCGGVLFGSLGVDPYHPKVVRGSMGGIFRLAVGIAGVDEAEQAASSAGIRMLGLAAQGAPLTEESWEPPFALVVGHERRGLGSWERLCTRVLAIPMQGSAESLSAAVAGSIALYEASRSSGCQESVLRRKSQDYRCQKSHGILRRR